MGSCASLKHQICLCTDAKTTLHLLHHNHEELINIKDIINKNNSTTSHSKALECAENQLLAQMPPKQSTYSNKISKGLDIDHYLTNTKNYLHQYNNEQEITHNNLLMKKKSTFEQPSEEDTTQTTQGYKVFQVLEMEQEEFIKEIIAKSNFATDFNSETIAEFAIGFYCIEFEKGRVLYSFEDEAQLFYIIESGRVELKRDLDRKYLGRGEYFGTDCFEECSSRLDTATVLETTRLLCCSGEFFRNAQNFNSYNYLIEKVECLRKIPIFKHLDNIKLMGLSKQLTTYVYKPNSIIVNENDITDSMYYIKSGTVRVTKKFKKIRKMIEGDYFCERGLMMKGSCYYTYSIENNESEIYIIPYKIIKELGVKDIIFNLFLRSIQDSKKISQIFIQNYEHFFNIFKLKYYDKNDVVFPVDATKNKKFCIMISGQIKSRNKNEILASTEEVFGDAIVDSRTNLDSEIVSNEEALILEASWEEIIKSSENDKNNNIDLCEAVQKLKRVQMFSDLKETQYLELAKVISKETYRDLETISREGELATKFFIIKTGKVKLYQKSTYIRELEQGGCFGEIPNITGEIRLFTVISSGVTECFVINREDFGLFDNELNKQIKQLSGLNDLNVSLPDLFFVKVLGNGRFGKVYLVHNQKHFYAIKFAKIKNICMNKNLMQYYYTEKRILLQIDHPFILKLVKTMKNEEHLFFLFEYIDGVTLKTYIDKRKKSSVKNPLETAFYGGILLTAINYLHTRKIIHRDIKPDNCMIDKNGYLKLIDFGVAKELKDKDTTMTICGTPHYLAPEIITGKGYSFSGDYWSLGITMFEIFYGYVPFGQCAKEPNDVYYDVLNKKLPLPYDPKNKEINTFFKIILSKSLMHRVCNYLLLKSHPFFHCFDFDQLLAFSIKAPYHPDSYIETNANNNVSMISVCNMSIRQYMESHQHYEDNTIAYEEEYEKVKKFIDDF